MAVLRDTTSGAPVLSGTVGSLIAVLDFCLVTNGSWTKPYTGTNLAAYQMPSGSSGRYLRIDDTGTTNGRIRLYETMSDVNTGTGLVPTDVQVSGGLYVYKSSAASSLARPWVFASYGNMAYLFAAADGTGWLCYAFGDPTSYRSGDTYQATLIANAVASAATTNIVMVNLSTAALAGHYITRSYTQLGSSTQVGKVCDSPYVAATLTGTMTYPCPIDSGLHVRPLFLHEGVTGRRALLPGLWASEHAFGSLATGDTFTGATGSSVAGRSFEYFRLGLSYAVVLETSNTWGL